MAKLLRVQTEQGTAVLFEVDELSSVGPERINRRGGDIIAGLDERLDVMLAAVRPAAAAVLDTFTTLTPKEVIVEFGVALSAEAGAVIAKTGASGHFTITLSWRPDTVVSEKIDTPDG